MKSFAITATLAFILSACGGGGGGASTSSTPEPTPPSPALASLTAQPLAGDKVKLTLSGVSAQASRYCIRQDATQPLAGDPCFADSDSTALVQEKTIVAASNTQRAVFTAWLLSGSTVSRHASVSAPGKTCSAAAYAALTTANTTLPAVCIITGSGSNTYESVLLLESVKAPITVGNFLRYVNQGFYDQTVFHRFWKGSLNFVQGGGFTYDANQVVANRYVDKASTLPPIVLESTVSSTLTNTAGTIAMARTSAPDSATAGFFVNTAANAGFNSTNTRDGYAVFGGIIHGATGWAALLDSVASTGEVTKPNTPVHLHWAYQIQ
jgi:cyclophilin family peptidyl-prolyl cis-trans isomerase